MAVQQQPVLLAVGAQAGRAFGSMPEALDAIFALLRPLLRMRTLFLSRIDVAQNQFRLVAVANEPGGLNFPAGATVPLDHTYCQRVAATHVPLAVADGTAEPFFAALPATRDFHVCGYLGVPVLRADGSLYGTLCGVDPEPHAGSDEEVAVMQALARLVAFQLEKEEKARLEGVLLAARTAQHEANNRLNAAIGYAEMVAEEPDLPESVTLSLTSVIENTKAAAAILQRLGRVDRIEETDWGMTTTIDLSRSAS